MVLPPSDPKPHELSPEPTALARDKAEKDSEMEEREPEVQSRRKSGRNSNQDDNLRQQESRNDDSNVQSSSRSDNLIENDDYNNVAEDSPNEQLNAIPQQLSVELGDDLYFSAAEGAVQPRNDSDNESDSFDQAQMPNYNQSTIIGGRADRLRKRKLQKGSKHLMSPYLNNPSATATVSRVRRLKLIRPPVGGSSLAHSAMPILTPHIPQPITNARTDTTVSITKPIPSISTPINQPLSSTSSASKSAFMAYIERLYNLIEDSQKTQFEEDIIRFAFDCKKRYDV
ncbi:hypothetical protein QR680_002968 [Steinernema hermaphroditum]|uniref:Uncharacterized protein n=1 Tax=Steinernema hermaphroditum TaxID=289476 RepID=A0AA39H7G4_9BILA|nr:hypothetical protein QR680_002968 [Steinernema hermaphroditum]